MNKNIKLKSRVPVYMASVLSLSCLIFNLAMPPVSADEAAFLGGLKDIRASEDRGDYKNAGERYYSILENECLEARHPVVSRGFEVALGRRAVACLTIAARKDTEQEEPGGGWEHSEALNMLKRMYLVMINLEPNNPAWSYLSANVECSEGRYVEARRHLQAAAKTTGGQASVRQKASKLLSYINKFADKDQAMIIAEDRAAVQAIMSGSVTRAWAAGGHVNSGNSGFGSTTGSSVSDSERRARDAESAGDYGAASRFRSGGTTVEDGSKYW